MKWVKSLDDLKEHIFSKKDRLAKRDVSSDSEKPKELFSKACNEIAEKLSGLGFKYHPSQHKLELESNNKKYNLFIQFSSTSKNVANKYVEFKALFYINSKELRKFSKDNPLIDYWNEVLISKDFGVLIDNEKGTAIWNLTEQEDYNLVLEIIPKICQSKLLHYFELFQDEEFIVTEIENGTFDMGGPVVATQYLLSKNKKKLAEKYLSNFVEKKSKIILDNYIKFKDEIKRKGIPEYYVSGYGYGYDIALLEKIYNLDLKPAHNSGFTP